LRWNVALWVKAVLRERADPGGDLSFLEPELRRLLEDPRLDLPLPGQHLGPTD
jgi:hypothetical protein